MQDQHKRTTATGASLISWVISAGIVMTLAALTMGILSQEAKATSYVDASNLRTYLHDGVLKDAHPAYVDEGSDWSLNLPGGARLDSGRISIEDENSLWRAPQDEPAAGTRPFDSASMQFLEENLLMPNAGSMSALARFDTADRIAALGNDVIDFSLGVDYYRDEASKNKEAEDTRIAGTSPNSKLRTQ